RHGAAMIDADALIELQEASYERAGGALRRSWPPESAMDAAQLVGAGGKLAPLRRLRFDPLGWWRRRPGAG
ncbi:MAG: hypothetical protein M3076_06450, partial [Actinomycetota bacterium]|nr:hypothetical protein [Actinomycetota bacterium]